MIYAIGISNMHKYCPRVAKRDVTLKTPDEGLHGDGDEDETINVTAHLSFRASAIDPISVYPDKYNHRQHLFIA